MHTLVLSNYSVLLGVALLAGVAVRFGIAPVLSRLGSDDLRTKDSDGLVEQFQLTPAELAYLASSGDMNRVVIVTAADLIQQVARAPLNNPLSKSLSKPLVRLLSHRLLASANPIKMVTKSNEPIAIQPAAVQAPEIGSQLSVESESVEMKLSGASAVLPVEQALSENAQDHSDYLENLCDLASRSISKTVHGKVSEHIPRFNPLNPFKLLVDIFGLIKRAKNEIGKQLAEIVAKPRSVLKFITPAGVLALALEIINSGYKESLREQVYESLLRQNLIMPEAAKDKFRRAYFAASIVLFLVVAYLAIGVEAPWYKGMMALFGAGLTVVVTSVLKTLTASIPFYDRVSSALGSANPKKGFRVTVISGLCTLISRIVGIGIGAIFFALTLISTLLVCLVSASFNWYVLLDQFLLGLNLMIVLDFVATVWKIDVESRNTWKGERILSAYRKQAETRNLVGTVRQVAGAQSYDPSLSNLIAVNGIELLLLL